MMGKNMASKVQATCFVFLLIMGVFSGVISNPEFNGVQYLNEGETSDGNSLQFEQRSTRAGVESWDWPMFHHNVHMTGAQDPSVTVPGNTTAYTFDSGGDIEATPAVVGDWVFFGNGFGPGDDYTFYGLNESDNWFWKYNSGNFWPWRGSPAVAEVPGYGLMVFASQSSGGNNMFYGFDADPDDNNDGVIDAFDNDEGQDDPPAAEYDIIWEVTLSYGSYRHSPLIADVPALGGYVIYLGTNDGTAFCLNAADGSTIWTWVDPTGDGFSLNHPTLGYDVNDNPMIFLINDGTGVQNTIYALDAVGTLGSTSIAWQSSLHGGQVMGGPALEVGGLGADDDRIFFITRSNPTILYCYDATPDDNGDNIIDVLDNDEGLIDLPAATYDLIWSFQLGGATNIYAASTPALHNDKVYIGIASSDVANNKLFALEQNGSVDHTHVIWTHDAQGDIYWNSPAVADGKVVITTRGNWGNPSLAVVDEVTGIEIWNNTAVFSAQIETSCSVAKGNIYVGGDDELLHVFGAGDLNNPPEAPVLYSPEDRSIRTTSGLVLDWSESTDPEGDHVSYTVEINDTNDFGDPLYKYTNVEASHLEVALSDDTWWWKVRAVDEFEARSDWSEVWNFTIDTINDLPMVTVTSPNGDEVWNGVHMINWTASDPEHENMTFNIWLSTDSGIAYNIPLAQGLGTHVRDWAFDTMPWPDGTTYRVKVEAIDARELGAFDTSDDDFIIDHSVPIYDDWPQDKHYANKTSYSPIDAPDTNSVAWISAPGYPREVRSSPAVFDGHVFYGDQRNYWYSLNETNGQLEWRYWLYDSTDFADDSMSVAWIPALNTYGVFGVSDEHDQYSFLLFDIEGLSDGDDGVAEAAIPHNAQGTWNADVLWAFYCDGPLSTSNPTVEGETVYIWLYSDSSDEETLYAFDVNGLFDGDNETMGLNDTDIVGMADRIWEYEVGEWAAAPTYAEGKLVLPLATSLGLNVLGFDADPTDMVDEGFDDPDGVPYDLLWSTAVDGSVRTAPAYHNDTIWLTTDGAPNIYSINATTGIINWEATDTSGQGNFNAAPAYWNDRIYVVPYNENISCYDATPDDNGNGIGGTMPGSGDFDEGYSDPPLVPYDLIWNIDPPGEQRGTPAVADGKVFVPGLGLWNWGYLYALDAVGNGDGTTDIFWYYYHDTTGYYAGPSVANGYVYQSTQEGEIFKFGPPTNADLAVFHGDIKFDPETPGNNNTWADITVRVSNLASVNATGVLLRITIDENDNGQYDPGETIVHNATISNVNGYEEVLVTVPWFASPADYFNFIVEVDPLNDINERNEKNNLAWNFYAVDVFAALDYIIINDTAGSGGDWVSDREYLPGENETFYAHGFNNTEGYIGDVNVLWSCNDTGVGTMDAGPSTFTSFTAVAPGYCMVNATYVNDPMIMNETGILHVLDWEIDYIAIVDTQGTGANEITNQTVSVGFSIEGWAAAFNDTGGYVSDISVTWSVENVTSTATTYPLTGMNSTFDANLTPGTAIWIADDGQGHNDTVEFTITEYTVDWILIVDTADAGFSEIQDQFVDVGVSIEGWAAAYNVSGGYIGDISVVWSVDNLGSSASTNPNSGVNSTFYSGSDEGYATWTAEDGQGHSDVVNFTVNPPILDYIMIVDSGGTGENEIPD
ncbi:MAG: PQQ-binding-like beta-propeller repeat protein, partial [Thermoplasmata archaeon]